MAMRPYQLTQFNPGEVDRRRTENRLNQMRVQQAESELDRQNRLMEILGGGGSGQPSGGGTNGLRNAALEAGGGPTKRAASMMDQAGGGMQAARTQPGGGQRDLSQREMMEVMALDPQLGARIQSIRESQSEQKRAMQDREAGIIARGADMIEQLPGDQRTAAWQAYKRQAANRGIDVSDWPDQYDPAQINFARAWAAEAGDYEVPGQGGGDMPSAVREAMFITGGDEEAARAYLREQAQRSGQTINVNAGGDKPSPLEEELAGNAATRIENLTEAGARSGQTEARLNRMAGLLTQEQINTGQLQPAVTFLQSFAEDVGVNLDKQAQSLGISLGDLSSKKEFERLSREVAMDVVQGFKGNTSKKELDFARSQVANLGDSEKANVRALAAMKAMNQIQRENAAEAQAITTLDDYREFQKDRLQRGPKRVRELTNKYEKQLMGQIESRPTMNLGGDQQTGTGGGSQVGDSDDGWTVERVN